MVMEFPNHNFRSMVPRARDTGLWDGEITPTSAEAEERPVGKSHIVIDVDAEQWCRYLLVHMGQNESSLYRYKGSHVKPSKRVLQAVVCRKFGISPRIDSLPVCE